MPKMTLGEAAYQNSMRMVRQLIEAGADPNVSEDGLVPLREACFNENIPMIKYLLEHGADVNARDGEGHNALFYVVAGMCPWQEVLPRFKLLFKYGIDLRAQDKHGHNILQHGSRLDKTTRHWLSSHGVKK